MVHVASTVFGQHLHLMYFFFYMHQTGFFSGFVKTMKRHLSQLKYLTWAFDVYKPSLMRMTHLSQLTVKMYRSYIQDDDARLCGAQTKQKRK